MLDVIKNRKIYLGISAFLVLASLVSLFIFGLNLGVEFRGGIQWQVSIDGAEVLSGDVKRILLEANAPPELLVRASGNGAFFIRLPSLAEEEKDIYAEALADLGEVRELSFSEIGPAVSTELRRNATWAIILTLIAISLYIAWAFRKVFYAVSPWKYGFITLVTLLHDVIIPVGLMAAFGHWLGLEVDSIFVIALLFVMGFSVNDTVVVFDRIRENLFFRKGKKIVLEDVINKSVNETLTRSINTSFTLIVVLIALIIAGPSLLFYFLLTVLAGTLVGTYSSIFLASPLLYEWSKRDA